MATSQRDSRLELARRLRESADRSSEQELRDALSRSYYSVYHSARVLLKREKGGLGHRELQAALEKQKKEIGEELVGAVKELYRLRENADYNPEMVTRDYGGDLERFRLAVTDALEKGRKAYLQILSLINQQTNSSGASYGTS